MHMHSESLITFTECADFHGMWKYIKISPWGYAGVSALQNAGGHHKHTFILELPLLAEMRFNNYPGFISKEGL